MKYLKIKKQEGKSGEGGGDRRGGTAVAIQNESNILGKITQSLLKIKV